MKTLKIGVILLALLLAAMIMVPMVNATNGQILPTRDANSSLSYKPEEFTIAYSGKDLTQGKIDERSDDLIKSFESKFGKVLPSGYLGSTSVQLADDEKIAAYEFRILPTGETISYADIVSANENDTAFVKAKERLTEWSNTILKEKTEAANSKANSLAPTATNALPAIITTSQTSREYSGVGRVILSTTWYWDNVETDSNNDYFYTQSYLQTNPGIAISGFEPYKNYNPKIEIDPGYSYTYSHMPGAAVIDAEPGTTTGSTTIGISLSSGKSLTLGWSTSIPDSSVSLTNPSGLKYRWTENFNWWGSNANTLFIFRPGVLSTSSQTSSRNGSTYVVSRVTADCENGFMKIVDGIPYISPTGTNYWGHLLNVRWSNGYISS